MNDFCIYIVVLCDCMRAGSVLRNFKHLLGLEETILREDPRNLLHYITRAVFVGRTQCSPYQDQLPVAYQNPNFSSVSFHPTHFKITHLYQDKMKVQFKKIMLYFPLSHKMIASSLMESTSKMASLVVRVQHHLF